MGSSNSSSNSLSSSSSTSSSSSNNSSSSSPRVKGSSSSSSNQLPPHLTQDPQQLQQLQTTFGRIQGTTFSEGMWQPGRLDAPRFSSTRRRLTVSLWAWNRSPSTPRPSRTTSTD